MKFVIFASIVFFISSLFLSSQEAVEERGISPEISSAFSMEMKKSIESVEFLKKLEEIKRGSSLKGIELDFFITGFIGEFLRLASYSEYLNDDGDGFKRIRILADQPIYSFKEGKIKGNRYGISQARKIELEVMKRFSEEYRAKVSGE